MATTATTELDTNTALDGLKWAQPAQEVGTALGLAQMLVALQLLATDQARSDAAGLRWDADTPASMQVIKAGAMAITRSLTKYVGAAGGLAAAASSAAALVAGLASDVGDAVIVALIVGAALVLSATALALALFARGDLEARGRATAARHTGRAQVAAAFLNATTTISTGGKSADQRESFPNMSVQGILLALAAFPGQLHIKTRDNPVLTPATGVRSHSIYGVQIGTNTGNWIAANEVTEYSTTA